jgi:MFS family permease
MRTAPLHPFRTLEARRLALVFAVVYFAQGMWNLPAQPITFVLKDRFGYSATQVASFFAVTTLPWLIKPAYGLVSDCVPLFGRRRKSYLILTCTLATAAGLALSLLPTYTPWRLALLFTAMGLGLAFTDVVVDALMVGHGKQWQLTGAFQSVQWASIETASVLVGIAGGALTERGALRVAFLLAALFPLLSLTLAVFAIPDARVARAAGQFQATWTAIRAALRSRHLWAVAGFIMFWTFSPSIGTPLYFYQTDTLGFSQAFIGLLASLSSVAATIGALAYAGMSRRMALKPMLQISIGIGVASTLAYLLYRDAFSALLIDVTFGGIGMLGTLAFLDLAAKACPKEAEGTVFALLMSLNNGGVQGSQILGGWLFDALGYRWLILLSATCTALCWLLVPLVRVEQIEFLAAAPDPSERPPISRAGTDMNGSSIGGSSPP